MFCFMSGASYCSMDISYALGFSPSEMAHTRCRCFSRYYSPLAKVTLFGDRQHSVYEMHISLNTSTYLSNNNE